MYGTLRYDSSLGVLQGDLELRGTLKCVLGVPGADL